VTRAAQPAPPRAPRRALPWCVACAVAAAHAGPAPDSVPRSELRRCAAIVTITERVDCYDRLAAGGVTTPAAPAAPAAPVGLAATTAGAPPPTPASAASPAADVADFGKSAAELRPAELPSISARVAGLGRSAGARPTVRLDNGQLWEMDADDPLLAAGDAVSIRRAALGSYLLHTPQGRTHHVRRLR
jgi:hypothetical protein